MREWPACAEVGSWSAGRNQCFPRSLVVPCAWIQSPKPLSLRDAVRDVAHHEEGVAIRDQVNHINLEAGIHFPNQPIRSPGSTASDPLTSWLGVTLCPPELNDVSLAENVVITRRAAAIRDMTTNSEVQKPSLGWNARWNRRHFRALRHTVLLTKELDSYRDLNRATLKISRLEEL